MRSPYIEHAASGLPNPTPFEGGGGVRFVQAQDKQVVITRSPRIITECLLTRSMWIKMYVCAIYSWFNDHLSGKELFIRFTASAFRKLLSVYVFSCFPFGFEGKMWDLIV